MGVFGFLKNERTGALPLGRLASLGNSSKTDPAGFGTYSAARLSHTAIGASPRLSQE